MLKPQLPATLVALFGLACTTSSFAEGPTPTAPAGAGDYRYEKTLTVPTRVEVRDQNGPIRVEPASGDALEIVAIKTGRKEDLDRVHVVTREEGGTIVVCAVWPGQDDSACRAGSSPTGRAEDVKVSVEFRLRVPSKVSLVEARTMNGGITARSPAGELHLHTMNGAVDVTANGPVTAETMNGAIVARTTPGRAVQLATKNGSVTVVLAAGANADVEASTMNGRVTSELGDVPAPAIPRMYDVKLRLGAGGTPISLRTLNGDVAVRRGS